MPSTARLISRPDPAGLGLRVTVGDPALDELAGETMTQDVVRCDEAEHPRMVSERLREHLSSLSSPPPEGDAIPSRSRP
jgi:hypothetical protein